jgi:hypothetical protein
MNTSDCMRTVRFTPYRKGMGPTFTLKLFYLGRCDNRLGYRLTQRDANKTTVLFEGEDFRCSSMHAQDSDECVKSLMGFLTLRPGDTDAEYFNKHTEAQLAYCAEHAETLATEVIGRFGE